MYRRVPDPGLGGAAVLAAALVIAVATFATAAAGDDEERFPSRLEAVEAWQNAGRRMRGENALVKLAIGNAYLAYGHLPQAIHAYRCGLRLDPGEAKLREALAYARGRVEYPPDPAVASLMQPERDYWPGWLSLQRLGRLAFTAHSFACLAVTRWRMTGRRLWLWLAVGALVIAVVPALGTGVESLRRQRDRAAPVVVLERAEVLRVGNGAEYPPRLDAGRLDAALPRGAEVRRLFERGGWYQVEVGERIVGWVPREAVVERY